MTIPRSSTDAGIVSLVPSITETLLVWGVEVAACTRFCEQPTIRHVGGTKNPLLDEIVEMGPRVVLMDTEENRREDFDELVRRGVRVVATEVHSVVDVDPALALVADAVGVAPPDPVAIPEGRALRRTALVPIWRRPWMVVGPDTYGASMLAALGIDVVPVGRGRYPTVEPSEESADLVLVPSEPYDFTDAHVEELGAAVPDAEVQRIDGQDLFWWGARTTDALVRLAHDLC